MSNTSSIAAISVAPTHPSKFEAIFNEALANYVKRTKKDLSNHPLASRINGCTSAESVLAIIREQSKAFDDFRNGEPRLIKCLEPVISCLYALSTSPILTNVVGLVCPPASAIFSSISVLLSMPKSVKASYDDLVDIFERVEGFVQRVTVYTEIEQPIPALTELVIKILAELIFVLALATQQVNQGKLKKHAKKLLGENEIESTLQRLDRLTGEETKMAVAQILRVVAKGPRATINEVQEKFQRWLSPPDPWSNHNIAREVYHTGTATWFIQSDTFAQWKSTGSLLWVNGLPGSGKTIISSSIIEELLGECQAEQSTLSIFYCDFRDKNKQDARNLLSSILIQLCHQSEKFTEFLSSLYSSHGNGTQQPSIEALLGCMKAMLALQGQGTLYVVVDALDECPNSSGIPTQRGQVLNIVKELISLKLPHFRVCVTSRPEIDIRTVFERLNTHSVPLHEQRGQIEDLAKYVESVVHLDPTMQDWPDKVKKHVIDTLVQKGQGLFRWTYCQLETLRQCPLRKISRALEELPETLDDTYERILLNIPKAKWEDAHRIFQWLAVSALPLHAEELAEVFAIDFDTETSGIPKFDPGWRPSNAEASVLSACSTLVSVVQVTGRDGSDTGERRVQFAHFSVKEYLTSDRIANSSSVSHFHILPKPAHTILAKACLSILFQLDRSLDEAKLKNFPLASYAVEHWADHARFEDVSSDIRDGLDHFFDRDQPHLAAWIWLYYMELNRVQRNLSPHPTEPDAVPLYYAALCGIYDLVSRLLDAHPLDLNAQGGYYKTPLLAALGKGHPNIALLLLERGADIEPQDGNGQTALYVASSRGYGDIVQSLIDRGADPNKESDGFVSGYGDAKFTPLLVASANDRLEVARILLEKGGEVNYQGNVTTSALHIASRHASNDLARFLLGHGANLNALDCDGDTALHSASIHGQVTVVTLLLKYGADVHARNKEGRTPFHHAAQWQNTEVVQVLLDRGADVNARMDNLETALHEAVFSGTLEMVELLLDRGADPHAQDEDGSTPFEAAQFRVWGRRKVRQLLSDRMGVKMEDDEMEDLDIPSWLRVSEEGTLYV